MVKPSLSIRSYTTTMCRHAHDYYQLVLPLNGHIEIALEHFNGRVGVGEGICISPGYDHAFTAKEHARFIVADLDVVPKTIANDRLPVFRLTPPMQSFLQYVNVQLTHYQCDEISDAMLILFQQLLTQQRNGFAADKRITPVLSCIHEQIDGNHTIESLARIACLGPTQFKKRFKSSTGMGIRDYLIMVRMDKARALLSNTDMPIIHVAANVGYDDVSAFSRRFKQSFGVSPKHYKRK